MKITVIILVFNKADQQTLQLKSVGSEGGKTDSVVKFIGHRRQHQGLKADAMMGGGTSGWLLCPDRR